MRIDAAADPLQRGGGAPVQLLAIDDAPARRLVAEQHVGADIQIPAWISSWRTSEMPSAIASAGLPGVRPLMVTVPSSGV